jgi:hypothetical protein
MKILLNNKRERSSKEIIITLGKSEGGFVYIGDSLNERSKIKIPLMDVTQQKNISTSTFNASIEPENKKDKSAQRNGKNDSINTYSEEDKNDIISSNGAEEPSVLAKMAEKINKQPIILPTCTQWFNFDQIHEIETKALPEFFCGKYPSKNPEIYKEYRNFIINLYRENVNSFLTATSKMYLILSM